MSASGNVPKSTPDPAASREEVELMAKAERTREELGETIEHLAAKADVKARLRAEEAKLTRQARDQLDRLGQKAASLSEDDAARTQGLLMVFAAIAAAVSCWLIVTWWKKR